MAVRRCRICGCTDDRACPGRCWWIAEDLCSSCGDHQVLNEKDCLDYLPFDDRDMDVRLLGDKMVNARFSHTCVICGGAIAPGERVRSRREVYDGQAKTFHFCNPCCKAMASCWYDGGHAIEYRTGLHPNLQRLCKALG